MVPKISVAPMMDRTDRYFRRFLRALTRHTLLYTEMVHARAVIHGDRARLLGYDPEEHPVSLQIGGSDARLLAEAARIGEDLGYDEIDLNVGCPSPRVQSGNFGCILMRTPELVAECIAEMQAAVSIPVTCKHRIGVDELDSYEHMLHFVDVVSEVGCTRFTVHARKAWLQGLSPKENRNIPPLRYDEVYRLKRERPHLFVEINGGVKTLDDIDVHLQHVDAVMIGRAAWDTPMLFAEVDRRYFDPSAPVPTAEEAIRSLVPWFDAGVKRGWKPLWMVKPMLNLFTGQRGTRAWKRALTEGARDAKGGQLLLDGLAAVEAARCVVS